MPVTTLSARFEENELDLLKRAAEAKRWSLAQLIRVGAYEKAVNILNASGDAAYPLRRQFASLLGQLLNPGVTFFDDMDAEIDPEEDVGGWESVDSYEVGEFSPADVEQLIRVIRGLGAEAAPILEDEFRRQRADDSKLAEIIDPATLKSEPVEAVIESRGDATAPAAEKGDGPQRAQRKGGKGTRARRNNKKEATNG